MTVLVRIVMLFIAYILACLAASIVLTIGTLTPHWNDLNVLGLQSPAVQSAALWSVIAVGTVFIFAVALLPMVLVIALTEGFALRSVVIYGVIGGALALSAAYGLDFFGYVARARQRVCARARSARRRRHRRRSGLLAVRRPQRRSLEVIA